MCTMSMHISDWGLFPILDLQEPIETYDTRRFRPIQRVSRGTR